MQLGNFISKSCLTAARFIIPIIPKGKSFCVRLALNLFGDLYNGEIVTSDGRKFHIDKISAVTRDLFFLKEFEKYECEVVSKILKEGDHFIDVGASFGWYSTLAGKAVGETGGVVAFEMVPEIVNELETNISLNKLENVKIEQKALGQSENLAEFYYSESAGMGNTEQGAISKDGKLKKGQCEMTTLDCYIENSSIKKVDFIKCDIDGGEVPFLRGASKTIMRNKPAMMIEVSDWAQQAHGHSCNEILEKLAGYGYNFFSLHHKMKMKPILKKDFGSGHKENVLCLPIEKMYLLDFVKNY